MKGVDRREICGPAEHEYADEEQMRPVDEWTAVFEAWGKKADGRHARNKNEARA